MAKEIDIKLRTNYDGKDGIWEAAQKTRETKDAAARKVAESEKREYLRMRGRRLGRRAVACGRFSSPERRTETYQ